MELPKLLSEMAEATDFTEEPVDDDTIGQILDVAAHAPSAGNLEPWKFVVVKDKAIKTRLAEASLHTMFVKDAPAVIVVCGDVERAASKYAARGEKLYVIQDTAYASMLIMLACSALDLGCYMVRSFDEDAVKEILEIPENIRPFIIIPIGHPSGDQQKEDRVYYENVTFLDKYGHKYEEKFPTLEEHFRKIFKKKEKQ